MNDRSKQFIKDLIAEYYKKNVIEVSRINEREFGVGDFDAPIKRRHIAFTDNLTFNNFLRENAPIFISYSSALYSYPDARPMESKLLKEAELVFDIDADDVDSPCKGKHPSNVVCEICNDRVKEETIKLVEDFLTKDFGVSKSNIRVNYSGNRGYHVHVIDNDLMKLNQHAREEISDYIDPDPESFDIDILFSGYESSSYKKAGPGTEDNGWRGRIARVFVNLAERGDAALRQLEIDDSIIDYIMRNRENIVQEISEGDWSLLWSYRDQLIPKIVRYASSRNSKSIDKNVTKDIYHLIRVPNTINGKSCMIAKEFSYSDIDRFDPMKDAIVRKDEDVKVVIKDAPQIYMNDTYYGPYKDITIELPAYVAAYYILKGYAELSC
ncbi:MAG: DNA primase small subunit PriS [Candidatus Micrarchaeota archaeon]|nr:MAG: DNA primase small subunit PriS [Candidatus Micrarchaeota archaeon]